MNVTLLANESTVVWEKNCTASGDLNVYRVEEYVIVWSQDFDGNLLENGLVVGLKR
jgi:hypothetical protein